MKRMVLMVLAGVILTGIIANAVWAEDPNVLSLRLVVKDGETSFRRIMGFETSSQGDMEDFHISANDINWEWYTPDEFENVIMLARDPDKNTMFQKAPTFVNDFLHVSIQFSAERDKKKLQQTLADIKKGIRVSKPVRIYITNNGRSPGTNNTGPTNFVGWAHWYVYGYTFTDKSGKEVDPGIYETRTGLFNALKFYCDKEVRAGRMTKGEANRMYRGLAHNVRNCDEVSLGDKLVNFRNLYDPYLFRPRD